jgi:hypothetical protein
LLSRSRRFPTQRYLFRKILKRWEQKDIDLAIASRKNQELEAKIEASRKVRRKKVQIDPNESFANIEAIRKAQIEAGEVSTDSDGSEDSETPSETRSVIVVGG